MNYERYCGSCPKQTLIFKDYLFTSSLCKSQKSFHSNTPSRLHLLLKTVVSKARSSGKCIQKFSLLFPYITFCLHLISQHEQNTQNLDTRKRKRKIDLQQLLWNPRCFYVKRICASFPSKFTPVCHNMDFPVLDRQLQSEFVFRKSVIS